MLQEHSHNIKLYGGIEKETSKIVILIFLPMALEQSAIIYKNVRYNSII